MVSFTASERVGKNSYQISCYMQEDGTISSFECKELDYMRKPTLKELLNAIKKKEKDDKRGFANPKAYKYDYRDYGSDTIKVIEVEVTSIRDERSVWVRYLDGKRKTRGTERRDGLYADKNALEVAVLEESRLKKIIKQNYAGLRKWEPKYKPTAPMAVKDPDVSHTIKDTDVIGVNCYEVFDQNGYSLGYESKAYIEKYNIPVREA